MKEHDIHLPGRADAAAIKRAIEAACSSAGLQCTFKDTLRAYPGCVHWHFKKGKQSGTLEATYWPQQSRAWFSIQSGRQAAWIDEAVPLLCKAVTEQLQI